MTFRVGQVWERDGRRREIVEIRASFDIGMHAIKEVDSGNTFDVYWRQSPKHKARKCWCSTWFVWAEKATGEWEMSKRRNAAAIKREMGDTE